MRSTTRLLLMLTCLLPLAAQADAWLKGKAEGPQILPVDSAFQLMPVERDADALRVSWFISKGYYLYRERMQFRVIDPRGDKLGQARMPTGVPHDDPYFGTVHIYRGGDNLAISLPLTTHAEQPRKLEVRYQGCAEAGVCYPPQTRILDIPPVQKK
ncbi:MAG: protein-disulfide reductase DsbD domain-containing protein [Stenotrophobium sp.]